MKPQAEVWQEAKSLLWRYRKGLGIGFALMIVNRLMGFVFPGSSKFLIDNVIGKDQAGLLVPLVHRRRRCNLGSGRNDLRALSGREHRRARGHYGDAPPRSGARHAAADPFFRRDAIGRPHFAHHDRRRGHSQPYRHGHHSARRRRP